MTQISDVSGMKFASFLLTIVAELSEKRRKGRGYLCIDRALSSQFSGRFGDTRPDIAVLDGIIIN